MSIIQQHGNNTPSGSISPSPYSDSSSSSSSTSFPSSPGFEFPVAAHLARRLRIASPSPGSYYSDELVQLLIGDLESESPESRRLAAMELRLLAKEEDFNAKASSIRIRIAAAGAVHPLVEAISDPGGSSPDPHLHEHAVTAILNLSLSPSNASLIVDSGAAGPLCRAVSDRDATPAARANAACALMRLARSGGEAACGAIGRAGAVPALTALLGDCTATVREHKDASAALYALCAGEENAANAKEAVEAGAVDVLVRMVAEEILEEAEEVEPAGQSTTQRMTASSSSSYSLSSPTASTPSSSPSDRMADRALCVLSAIVAAGGAAAAEAVAGCGGLGILVELLEGGTRRQREAAAEMLMRVCGREGGEHLRRMAATEGAVPPLVELSQTGSPRARKTAEALTTLLRLTSSSSRGSRMAEAAAAAAAAT